MTLFVVMVSVAGAYGGPLAGIAAALLFIMIIGAAYR